MLQLLHAIVSHPANHNARVKALMRAVRWQFSKRLTGRPRDLSYHGKILRCHPTNHSASRAIYFSGLPDYREMRFILDYLRPGDTFVDAGANVGLYTLLALSVVGDSGHVHAFEPNPQVAAMLRESLALNAADNVTVHEIGLADVEGSAAFSADGDDCTSHIVGSSTTTDTQIPIGRLDRILDDIPYAMMKFDIEGYEPFAIRGASEWTKSHNPPVMLIEMAGYSKRHGISTSEFIEELERIGYVTAIYNPNGHELQPTKKPWEVPIDNVLAIADDRFAFVENRLRQQTA
ncbi:Methyltransferase domain protein [Stieleria neptunia]|uniref:Methyltransferase domain protein n=1 Tax=Stieleria neptunia TaxID=2527979 RepID=A0A518HYL3_9BACT|nr:FkbM family methyltransferase [Stieleria neptunia]QDV45940.1 Methyltransferase domain protein [Stieleria neptunia]